MITDLLPRCSMQVVVLSAFIIVAYSTEGRDEIKVKIFMEYHGLLFGLFCRKVSRCEFAELTVSTDRYERYDAGRNGGGIDVLLWLAGH
ncbi:MAG: hypothetical protein MRK01_07675 [Candidatus Scalindua sp.]|nr:hypothetical protein [Candidatus Scalindua sp.]